MKRVWVNIKSIDWGTEFYKNINDEDFCDIDLPDSIREYELCLSDYNEDIPYKQLDEGIVEDALIKTLMDEYKYEIDLIEWKYIKYEVYKEDGKYIIKDKETDTILAGESGEPEVFDTEQDANDFVDILQILTNNK